MKRKLPIAAQSPLPPLHAGWVQALLGAPIPTETEATCDDCAMVGAEPGVGSLSFDPGTKCCTFVPDLPSYLVGAILTDRRASSRQGRRSVERRLSARAGVTPLGLLAPAHVAEGYDQATGDGGFGRDRSLLCPHFVSEGGRCGIWEHREATCSTWYCKHVRGATGMRFWRGALLPLLQSIQVALSRWCALRLELGAEALERLAAGARASRAIDRYGDEPEAYRLAWGSWAGREREFYVECARLVAPLELEAVLRIGGAEVELHAALARAAFARLRDSTLPPTLRPGGYQVSAVGPETTRVWSYSRYDPLDVPSRWLGALGRLDGRPTPRVIEELERLDGIEDAAALLRALRDFGILLDDETGS